MNRFQVIGVNDSKDFCECCGKQGLKRVVWILDNETGEEKHFGTTCANAPAKGFDLKAEIKEAIGRFDAREKGINWLAFSEYRARGGKYMPHPTKADTRTPADPALYAAVRAEVIAKYPKI